jgi:hypothetical protein
MAGVLVQIGIAYMDGEPAEAVAGRVALGTDKPKEELVNLSRELAAIAGGLRPSKVSVRVDSTSEAKASLALAVTQANLAAGEYLDIVKPSGEVVRLLAVASGADPAAGTFVSQTSNTVTAQAIRDAINKNPRLMLDLLASESSGTVTIQALRPGTYGNSYRVVDGTVNALSPAGGSLAGGLDASQRATGALTILDNAEIAADETFRVGAVLYTWKASAGSATEVTIGADANASADNIVSKINNNIGLIGVVSAERTGTGVVTLTYLGNPRDGVQLYLAVSDATSMSATAMSGGTGVTLANSVATRQYNAGGP